MKKNLLKAAVFIILGVLILAKLSFIENFLMNGRQPLGDGQDIGYFLSTLTLTLILPFILLGTSITFIISGLVQLRKYFKYKKINPVVK